MQTKKIIELCGGAANVSQALGLAKSAVYYWINESENGIPRKYEPSLIALAKEFGNELTRVDFVGEE